MVTWQTENSIDQTQMLKLFRSLFQDPSSLNDAELEPAFVDLKNRILRTNAYTEEEKRKRLYKNIELILERILSRHERYILDIEAQRGSTFEIAKLFHKRDESRVHWPARPLNKANVGNEYLFYLSIFAYRGGLVRNIGLVFPNPEYAIELLDFMIREREYLPAFFLKGVIYKYGLRPEDLPNLREAKGMLDTAANKGVGGAAIELRQFDVHERLNKYDQAIEERYRR